MSRNLPTAQIHWMQTRRTLPPAISIRTLSIAENSAIGSIIGEFNATDPEGDSNLTFHIFPYPPRLWLDAEDNSSIVHTDGNVTRWKNKVSDQHDAVLASGNASICPMDWGTLRQLLIRAVETSKFWIVITALMNGKADHRYGLQMDE